jgi:hypothetical protein
MAGRALRLGQLKDSLYTGKLAEESIKLAKTMMLCTLPYSQTKARHITRRARLGDGSDLVVRFSAGLEGIDLPFGADRRLLAWLLDRAAGSETPFVPWSAASEYQRDVGISHGGRCDAQLRESFRRLRGMVVSINHKNWSHTTGENFFFIRKTRLPRSIMGDDPNVIDIASHADAACGFVIDPTFHSDMRKSGFHVAVPRDLWLQLRGSLQVQDMVLFFYWRCYAAREQSVMPWAALEEHFGASSNPRRQRAHAREAVAFLRHLWPGCTAEVIDIGIMFDHVSRPMLLNDPSKKRVRMLSHT